MLNFVISSIFRLKRISSVPTNYGINNGSKKKVSKKKNRMAQQYAELSQDERMSTAVGWAEENRNINGS